METIKVEKITEEIPIEKAVDLASQVLKRPEGLTERDWRNELSKDFTSGKKFFTIREMKLSERLDQNH